MRMKRVAATVASAVMMAGIAIPAFAVTVPAGGGTWSYGTTGNGTSVYSNYHHPSVFHKASTINYWGEHSCSQASARYWARTSQRANPDWGAVDHSYWGKGGC